MKPITTRTRNTLAVLAALLVIAVVVAYAVDRRTPPQSPTTFVPTTWEAARTSPMHAAHVGRATIACTECHATGFEQKPTEALCARCHEAAAKHAHRGAERAPTTCATCHVFAANKQAALCVDCHAPTPADVKRPPEGPAAAAHALARHVSKDVACGACHALHGDPGAGAGAPRATQPRVVLADCTACHTNVTAVHGRDSVLGGAADDDAGVLSFDAAVARFAADARAASALREAGAGARVTPNDVTHAAGAVCSTCHAPHTEAARANEACARCHVAGESAVAAPRVAPRGRKVAGHDACSTCHEPHRARKEDVRACASCHGGHRGATTAHAACTTCHAPHAPAEAGASCRACHGDKRVLAETRIAAHAACESCHDPHRPEAAPALACARCHEAISPEHPTFDSKTRTTSVASACVGCHAPHGSAKAPLASATAASASAAACSSCHTKAKSDLAFHASPKTACKSCHAPHAFTSAVAGAAACKRCHAPEGKLVEARTGHAECKSCHADAHAPSKKPACTPCHAEETRTALAGHRACTQCHDAHSGSLGQHAECTSCHADKTPATKALHAALPSGCASCHRPHGPKGIESPPACGTCHSAGTLRGLHGVAAHALRCATCHTAHGPPRSDRATCTGSCHVDRRSHQPEAQVCEGCHIFRR